MIPNTCSPRPLSYPGSELNPADLIRTAFCSATEKVDRLGNSFWKQPSPILLPTCPLAASESEILAELNHLQSCVQEGREYQAAIATAAAANYNQNPDIRSGALKLFKLLVEKGEGKQEAFSALLSEFRDLEFEKPNLIKSTFNLYESLLKNLEDTDRLTELVNAGMKHRWSNMRSHVLKSLKQLAPNGQVELPATHAAALASQDPNFFVRQEALLLLIELVKNNRGYQPALEAATLAVQDIAYGIRVLAFQLFDLLLDQGVGKLAARDAAAIGKRDVIGIIQDLAEKLDKKLDRIEQAASSADTADTSETNPEETNSSQGPEKTDSSYSWLSLGGAATALGAFSSWIYRRMHREPEIDRRLIACNYRKVKPS